MPATLKSERNSAIWLIWSAVLGLSGVAAGAFGAHALRGVLSERMFSVYQTAVQYQLLHAVVLAAVSILLFLGIGRDWPHRAALCLVAGTLVFSGSLYLMCLSGIGWLGAVTPLGGVLLLCGWLCVLLAGMNARKGFGPTDQA